MRLLTTTSLITLFTALFLVSGCSRAQDNKDVTSRTAEVTASAYTLAEDETKKGNIGLAAWGDQLKPGMEAIAVSRDLIKRGLTHNTLVTIEGLQGKYRVLDKMNKRWHDKIDILMSSKAAAREWGKQTVKISWHVKQKPGE